MDEDVYQRGEDPVLCGYRQIGQVRDQRPAAGGLHHRLCARKTWRTGSEDYCGPEGFEDGRPDLYSCRVKVRTTTKKKRGGGGAGWAETANAFLSASPHFFC